MNTPETINIEKYAEALNNLIGADSAYFRGDKDVGAIVEVIVAAKKLENRVKELTEELENERTWADSMIDNLRDDIRELTEENEYLQQQNEIYTVLNKKLEDVCESYAWQYGTAVSKELFLKKERADTVKKMQERLKSGWCTDNERCCEFIDQIAKELLEATI